MNHTMHFSIAGLNQNIILKLLRLYPISVEGIDNLVIGIFPIRVRTGLSEFDNLEKMLFFELKLIDYFDLLCVEWFD